MDEGSIGFILGMFVGGCIGAFLVSNTGWRVV